MFQTVSVRKVKFLQELLNCCYSMYIASISNYYQIEYKNEYYIRHAYSNIFNQMSIQSRYQSIHSFDQN